MGDLTRSSPAERDIEQAITALKKGATLLKYGRRGKPKFSPFRLSSDESTLIWYSGKDERQIKLNQVIRIIPGQRTTTFQRYPRPDKEYQSFSLILSDRTLDLICKDKEEAEVWFIGLKALISNTGYRRWRTEPKDGSPSSDTPPNARKFFQSFASSDPGELQNLVNSSETQAQGGLGKAFSDLVLYTGTSRNLNIADSGGSSLTLPSGISVDNSSVRCSAASDNIRVSLSSAVSSSSHGSCHDDFDSLGDVFLWGEGLGEGILGGGTLRVASSTGDRLDAFSPKALQSTVVLDVQHVAGGGRHAALVTKQGEMFSWGEESGGRLGHGVEVDVSHPKLIGALTGMNVELVACGEYHTCAVTVSGDLFTWGDGTRNSGLLGHGSEASHWIPKKVGGLLEGLHITYVSCGPWHTAVLTSFGQLFTFGDGTFGALGHGDRSSVRKPKEVEALAGLRTVRVACGGWHTAAIVEMASEVSSSDSLDRFSLGKLFTWGDGDNGQLGHGDKEARFTPERVASVGDLSFSRVACGRDFTTCLATSGRIYSMGNPRYGQLGNPESDGKIPQCIGGKITNSFIEEISCGSHHVAVLTSKAEVYTWGKGANGQLGHGDGENKKEPTLVDALKDKQVKSIACGTNFTAVICLHKWMTSADHSSCTGCHGAFNFRRKRHNCYNCGLVFCKACSSRKSVKASLAPNMTKPYRVCDDCFAKLKKTTERGGQPSKIPKPASRSNLSKSYEADKETSLTSASKFAVHLSRLSFVDTLRKTDSGSLKSGMKLEKYDSVPSAIVSDGFQGGSQLSASPPHFGASNTRISASAPGSRMSSRASSPISLKQSPGESVMSMPYFSPSASPEVTPHRSVYGSESSSKETAELRAQVENLTRKVQSLESELEKTSRQLKEAKTVAADEAEKARAAKEVIRSLTGQLKEMGERAAHKGSSGGKKQEAANASNDGDDNISLSSPKTEAPAMANGTKTQTDKAEWIVQDEPGVYITLSSLPNGAAELKRVRFRNDTKVANFSKTWDRMDDAQHERRQGRKRFSEGQAEKWWAENGDKVCERHNIKKQ